MATCATQEGGEQAGQHQAGATDTREHLLQVIARQAPLDTGGQLLECSPLYEGVNRAQPGRASAAIFGERRSATDVQPRRAFVELLQHERAGRVPVALGAWRGERQLLA